MSEYVLRKKFKKGRFPVLTTTLLQKASLEAEVLTNPKLCLLCGKLLLISGKNSNC